ncbi:hypothetical protein [Actinoplanes teichomyceticus]|uniref:hypothetical protein n=1 Tax=Actinoplanes teichomyceticus TaxID=1867 RepID=UPI001A506289|nr:hypothetical protein [Actinoplanes teichomyceticus]GIF12578.1 hypothetical protein Ate01nite_26100 [Actinoplanes teichomyceticus]
MAVILDLTAAVLDHYPTITLPGSLREEITKRMGTALTNAAGINADLHARIGERLGTPSTRSTGPPARPGRRPGSTAGEERRTTAQDPRRAGRLAEQLDDIEEPPLIRPREVLADLSSLLTQPREVYRRAAPDRPSRAGSGVVRRALSRPAGPHRR